MQISAGLNNKTGKYVNVNRTIQKALSVTNKAYKKNPIRFNDLVAKSDKRVQFTLRCSKSSYIIPARQSASGRHTRAVSWQAHREFMRNLFEIDPNARINTSIAVYNGETEFYAAYPETYQHNVGSTIQPVAIGDCEVKAAA